MNSGTHRTLYIILNYALNDNIFELISSIQQFCFSFISLSLQYDFQLYLIYNNTYILLFPSKLKDPTYFITSNYSEISKSISDTLENFFNNVSQAEEKLSNDFKNNIYPINIIFKKILLELNQKNKSKSAIGDGNFFLSANETNGIKDRILLINDSENDFDNINQKYIFLLKKEKIKIDILSLNKKNKNSISKSICLFTNGFFDNVTNEKSNIGQILIQEYIPLQTKDIFRKNKVNIKDSINYNKSISDKSLICSKCHKPLNNNNSMNNNFQNYINNNNSTSNNKLFYFEQEKNIFCKFCLEKMKK
jgi:hypothetical protein